MTPGEPGRFLTTLPYTRRAAWTARADIIDPAGCSTPRLVGRLVRGSRGYDAVVLNGSVRSDQLAAALIARRRRPPAVVLVDATWKTGAGAFSTRARRAAVRALDHPDAHYCVLSSEETRVFANTWGVQSERVHFTPFHWVFDEELVQTVPEPTGGIFAGGDSLRDYGPLIKAADGLPAHVTIASRTEHGPVPPNVTLAAVDPSRYDELFRGASVVVVPIELRGDRSAGQQTYLNAMVLGKPVIVTDAPGVRDHIEDRRTGLIVPPGQPTALRAALDWVLDPRNAEEVRALGLRGRAEALERFGPENYVRSLLEVVDIALDAQARTGDP